MKSKLILVGNAKRKKRIFWEDNIRCRSPRTQINFNRFQLKKAKDRKRLIKQIVCLYCETEFDCHLKKVKNKKTGKKEEEPLNQFCRNRIKCNSKHISFRSKLARMRMDGSKNDKLVAEYVLHKLMERVPAKFLMPILESKRWN